MSGRIVREVLENAPEDLTTSELLVLITLAEDASDHDRKAAHITIEQLAHRARIARGTTRNVLMGLTRRCLIQPTEKVRPGNGRRQIYIVANLTQAVRKATIREAPADHASRAS